MVKKQPIDEDKFTIALIGDSFVCGLGVKDNQKFGKLLEKRLNKIKLTKVLNLGLQNDNIIDNLTKFQYLEEYYDIDLYVIAILHNDLYIDSFERYKNSENTYSFLAEKCPGNNYNIPNYGDNPESLLNQLLPENNNSCLYKEFLNSIASSNKPTIIFSYESVSEFTDSITSEYESYFSTYDIENHKNNAQKILLKFMTDEATKRSIETIDIGNTGINSWDQISKNEWHPSKSAHRLFALSLYKEIINSSYFKEI